MVFQTAVIGLGNIGFKFSYDEKRAGTWSHVDAYGKCPSTNLVAAVEIDKVTIDLFHTRYPSIPVYSTVEALFAEHTIDIVSLCVPTKLHYPMFKKVSQYSVKAIFCEKPLSLSVGESREMVRLAQENGILLAINYTRRWQNSYIFVKKLIDEGKIGNITAITAYYPGQIYNIGSHLFDTVRMISGLQSVTASAIKINDAPDPSISGWLLSENNVFFSFVATGKHEDLIFEIDVVGDLGRIRILENGEKVEYFSFQKSKRYSSYRELVPVHIAQPLSNDRFADAIQNIADVLGGSSGSVLCSGTDGLYVDMMLESVLDAASNMRVTELNQGGVS
jgi:predicted dehydrogenase